MKDKKGRIQVLVKQNAIAKVINNSYVLKNKVMKKLFIILFFILFTPGILHSQWVQQSVPVNKPITGIKFIDSLKGWACTTEGTSGTNYGYILHTTNGGANWFIQDSSINTNFQAISVIDNNTIYAGGDSVGAGKLSKTTNGGISWIDLTLPVNMIIGDMQFLNQDSGWTCVHLFGADVRTTTDGGLNWTQRTSGIASQTQRIFFLNYNTGFCGANTFLYKTTNAGVSWNLLHTFSMMVQSIYFMNIDTAWAGLSPSGSSAKVGYTTDGGINWVIQSLDPYNLNISDIFFLNNQIGFAGIGILYIYKTRNSGLNWGYQNDTSGSYRMSFTDSLHGWTGNNGISHTINGGGQITYLGIININNNIPKSFELFQNYPNPFNSQTNIRFSLFKPAYVSFKIYDVLGKEKFIWQSDKLLQAGTHELQFDAKDLASGVYFYEIILTDESDNILYKVSKKMILVK